MLEGKVKAGGGTSSLSGASAIGGVSLSNDSSQKGQGRLQKMDKKGELVLLASRTEADVCFSSWSLSYLFCSVSVGWYRSPVELVEFLPTLSNEQVASEKGPCSGLFG